MRDSAILATNRTAHICDQDQLALVRPQFRQTFHLTGASIITQPVERLALREAGGS
ncbi:MAG: hypothetical protein JO166_03570 [Deltaproteobacteria bacterium]|nr:hypothetical protein [Deltaproteobacteria bacterium]